MSMKEYVENENVAKFLQLLDGCYGGNLKAFSDDFSNFDNSFYEKLKKEVQRAKVGQVSPKKEDVFKKYNFFLKYKIWEQNNQNTKMKKFDLTIEGLIESLCK
ncbi:hypothetical protein ACG9ZB_03550 [Acinetobacter johnsonii]|uniref:hypothetical protein n=1 Tax=Acinetobacter johnsonii TaxID=40214 RepID=UPI003AF4392C